MKNLYRFRYLIIAIVISISFTFVYSCKKADSDIKGCVYGKIKHGKDVIQLGCMTKVEFYRYLENPNQVYDNKTIDRELTFNITSDCNSCQ